MSEQTLNEQISSLKNVITKLRNDAPSLFENIEDPEAYFEQLVDVEQINCTEGSSCLFQMDEKTVLGDFAQAETIETDHISLVYAKVENMNLVLDTWKARKITFRYCIFENSAIESSQKEIAFIGCVFYGKDTDTRNTRLLLTNKNTLTNCAFKNIAFKSNKKNEHALSLSMSKIIRCLFADCKAIGTVLLYLKNSSITDSEFIRCRCDDRNFPISVNKTSVDHCNFFDCETDNNYDYPVSILNADASSKITFCRFERCKTKSRCGWGEHILTLDTKNEHNNTFHDCLCGTEIYTR